jgi:hypothetical protein
MMLLMNSVSLCVDTRQDDDSLLLRHVEEPIWEPNEQGAPRSMENDGKHVRVSR